MKEKFQELISILPHSNHRVPFTYHHDYLRQNVPGFIGMSRSEVAKSHDSTDEQLYAIALIMILQELGSTSINYLRNDEDLNTCRSAFSIANALKNLN